MTRKLATSIENNLTKGLVTEASGLNFPENACTETFNCIFHPNGRVVRRPAFNYLNEVTETQARVDNFITSFVWKAPGGDGDLTYLVMQHGSTVRFYSMTAAAYKAYTIELNDYDIGGNTGVYPCQFASGNGDLYIVNRVMTPIHVRVSSDHSSITITPITIQIRDFEGVDDGLEPEERVATGSITDEHIYNLFNQGWYLYANSWTISGDSQTTSAYDILDDYTTEHSEYPSNAEIPWLNKNNNGSLNAETRDATLLGNSLAPRGHVILDAFDQDRTLASGQLGNYAEGTLTIANIEAGVRPTAIAFFAGRAWYGGVNEGTFSTKVYFSQIIERDDQFGKCYQVLDPVSEHLSDLLPTDGGVVSIADIGNIIKFHPMGDSLYVFATNGIWAISGSEGVGFRANDYSIRKVSSVGVIAASSFVDVEGTPIWWTVDGIYTLKEDPASSNVVNLSLDIRDFFREIPAQSITYAKGAYNVLDGLVQWVYKSNTDDDIDGRHDYDRVLNYNVKTATFYPWSLSDHDTKLNGIFSYTNPSASSGDSTKFYYLAWTTTGTAIRIATCEDTSYLDWGDEDYSSYGISGFKLHAEGNKDFQTNYITVYLENDSEDSSLLVRGVWDFSRTITTNRWSEAQEAYNFQDVDDYAIVFKKMKMRGAGKALQIKFESSEGQPFTLLGWAAMESSNASV